MLLKGREKLKLIGLDVDGVLSSMDSLHKAMKNGHAKSTYGEPHKMHVLQLGRIVKATGAKILFTSSWRGGWRTVQMSDYLSAFDPTTTFEFVGRTPRFIGEERGKEIRWWLNTAKLKPNMFEHRTVEYKKEFMCWDHYVELENMFIDVEKLVILDDDTDMKGVKQHFLHIDREHGLTEELANEAIRRLGGKVSKTILVKGGV